LKDSNLLQEEPQDNKIVIYQMMTRLFGNKNTTNKKYGTIQENGVGKFNDINELALTEIKKMGVTHVWFTGVLEHATMTDYTKFKIPLDDIDVVKGRAGSPYAIKDYYDVNPDFAENIPNRMKEFEALITRTHAQGLKVIIDFVPNHVARKYKSDVKPTNIKDFGQDDDKTKAFSAQNNFYYITGKKFQVPASYKPLGDVTAPTKDGMFAEMPAKATGNDQFTATPTIDDWFETVKLNYGVDYQNNRTKNFEPIPNTWEKMYEILDYWALKGVDAFRCDMAEMVPVEFWAWVIPKIQAKHPKIFFIAEIYGAMAYRDYIDKGKFKYLYDKVGLYDTLRHITEGKQTVDSITQCWRFLTGINDNMCRFLENHDEQRIASEYFAGDGKKAIPAMVVTATLTSSPIMIYFGQEVGENASEEEGFAGKDGRTTIFDYWGVPAHQAWMNEGKFDGGKLTQEQKNLRNFYVKILNLSREREAIRKGRMYDLNMHNRNIAGNGYGYKQYAYLRFTETEKLLIVLNFDTQVAEMTLKIPQNALNIMKLQQETLSFTDILMTNTNISAKMEDVAETTQGNRGIKIKMQASSAYIFEIK
jgi:glycosidase